MGIPSCPEGSAWSAPRLPGRLEPMSHQAGELLLVTHRDPALWHGGGPTYVRAWAQAAVESGYHPHILTLGPRSESEPSEFGMIHRVRSPIGRYSSQTLAVNSPVLGLAAARLLAQHPGHHVVHGFSGWPLMPTAARRRLHANGSLITRVQTAWTTLRHEQGAKFDSDTTSGAFRRAALAERGWNLAVNSRVQGRVFRTSDVVLVNYRSTARIVTDEWGTDLPVRLVPYLPESAFDDDPSGGEPPPELTQVPGVPLIMTMSRHVARKGLDVLLRALALLRDRGVEFRACLPSTGRLLETHRQLARDLDLAHLIQFPGLVADPRAYIRAGDIFVLPSYEEGCGSVSVLEAMQAARPVVASDIDGMSEDLTDGSDGLLVAPGDVRALAERLARLVSDPALRRDLGAAARQTFERRFSRNVVVPQVARLYAELGLPPSRGEPT